MNETVQLEPATRRKYEEYIEKGLDHETALYNANEEAVRLAAIQHTRDLRQNRKVGTPPTLYKGTDPSELMDINYLKRQQGVH